MKGHPQVIEVLQKLRVSELTAYQMYTGQSEAAENWGLHGLSKQHADRAQDENRHMGMLDARILFLEGQPAVSQINDTELGNAVPLQISIARKSEDQAIADYRAAIAQVESLGDYVTGKILREILNDEETDHLNELESYDDQIAMMGLGQFLATIVKA